MKLILSESFEKLIRKICMESRVAKIICRILNRQIKIEIFGGRLCNSRFLVKNLKTNYIAWRETSGLISFWLTQKGPQPINEDGKWIRKGRQDMRISAWAKSILSPKILKRLTDEDFNVFSTLFKREEKSHELRCEIISGAEEIDEIYGNKQSFGSCMRNMPVGKFYEKMGADILVCWDGNGKLVARAILWPEIEFKTIGGKFRLLDRIYFDLPCHESFVSNWARENGFVSKKAQSRHDKDHFCAPNQEFLKGEYINLARNEFFEGLKVEFGYFSVSYYPYLDTFTRQVGKYFYNDENDRMETAREFTEDTYIYNNTDGTREIVDIHEGEVQDIDGDWIDENDAVEVDGYWYLKTDDRIAICENDGEYYLKTEMKIVHLSMNNTIYIHERHVEDAE